MARYEDGPEDEGSEFSPVARALDELDKALDIAQETFGVLTRRIQPSMSPETSELKGITADKIAAGTVPDTRSELLKRIQASREHVEHFTSHIRETNDRVQL